MRNDITEDRKKINNACDVIGNFDGWTGAITSNVGFDVFFKPNNTVKKALLKITEFGMVEGLNVGVSCTTFDGADVVSFSGSMPVFNKTQLETVKEIMNDAGMKPRA